MKIGTKPGNAECQTQLTTWRLFFHPPQNFPTRDSLMGALSHTRP